MAIIDNIYEKDNYDRAWRISKFMFCWINGLLWKGYKKELEVEDLYSVPKCDQSNVLGDRLERNWRKQVGKRKPSLTRALMRTFGLKFMLLGIYTFFEECGLHIAQPWLIGKLIDYFTPGSKMSFNTALFYATGIVLCSLVYPLTHHPYFFGVCHMGMKIRVACCNLVYRKILRLSNSALKDTTAGHMVNLLSNDVSRFDQGIVLLHFLWVGPLQAIIASYILWGELEIACIVGMTFLLLLIPLQIYMGRLFWKFRLRTAKLTDDRLRITNEIVSGMRIIKIYGWEKPFSRFVSSARKKETRVLMDTALVRGVNMAIYAVSIKLILFLTFFVHLSLGKTLSAHTVFLSVALYNNVRVVMTLFFPFAATQGAEVMVSLHRLQKFLLLEEKVVEMPKQPPKYSASGAMKRDATAVRLLSVTAFWEAGADIPTLRNISATIKARQLFAIIGPVGSGKTSLLMAILKELPLSSGYLEVTGSVAYTSQQPWIFHSTLRSNIILGNDFNGRRYEAVLKACSLEKDIALLPYGDQTLVGEKGAVLSGGQKARVNLARALYINADIYLLDDPFSAVDAEVGRHLYEKCILKYLQTKVRILVTHQLQYLRRADQVMVMKAGECVGLGTYDQLLSKGIDLQRMTGEAAEMDEKRSVSSEDDLASPGIWGTEEPSKQAALKQLPEEKRGKGAIKCSLYWKYFQAGGNTCLTLLLILLTLISQVLFNGIEYWLAYWTNSIQQQQAKENWAKNQTSKDFTDKNQDRNFYIYLVLLVSLFVFSFARCMLFYYLCVAASRNLHRRMFNAVVRSPMIFFDMNPVGRILNRFSKDIGVLDELLPLCLDDCIDIALKVIGIVILVCITNYWIIFPTVILACIFYVLRRFYMKTSRALKRLDAITRSPVFSHLSSTLNGLSSVRAFHVENRFQKEFDSHQDLNSSAWFLFLAAGRWLAIYLDCLCNVFIIFTTYSFMFLNSLGGDVGLAITSALGISGMFQWGVRQSAEVESQMVSVERIIEYTKLQPEAPLNNPDKKVAPEWPQKGAITFQNVEVRYGDNSPVLKNLNFTIKSGEKIGIVGRTGAGKSTLIATLFRLTEPTGVIKIDNVNIKELGLHDLRRRISIIPQDPVIFQGSLRLNLDCFLKHTDEELWKALEVVKMKDFVKKLSNGLDSVIQEGGTNISIGQRQLICLARAILRNNKILILDEATANIDHETDILIQETIRSKFKSCTVLTVAHRLNTIIDSDRVMVLSEGRLVEFNAPHILLRNEGSFFSDLVNATGRTNANHLRIIATELYKAKVEKKGPVRELLWL